MSSSLLSGTLIACIVDICPGTIFGHDEGWAALCISNIIQPSSLAGVGCCKLTFLMMQCGNKSMFEQRHPAGGLYTETFPPMECIQRYLSSLSYPGIVVQETRKPLYVVMCMLMNSSRVTCT